MVQFIAAEGYYLRAYRLGREDRWCRFFTRELGLVSVIAARRQVETSALAFAATLDQARLLLLPRRSQGGTRLVEYELVDRHFGLVDDPLVWGWTMFILELVERLSPEEAPQPQVYALLESCLAEMRRPAARLNVAMATVIGLFAALGYGLDFAACRTCGGAPADEQFFVGEAGGFYHRACARPAGGLAVSQGTLRFLEKLATLDATRVRRLGGDALVRRETYALATGFAAHLCHRRLRSQQFLEKLAGDGTVFPGRRR